MIGVAQSVPHTGDVAPGLLRHQRSRALAEAERRLANALKAALDGISLQSITPEGIAVHAGYVALDPSDVVDDIGQAVGRAVV